MHAHVGNLDELESHALKADFEKHFPVGSFVCSTFSFALSWPKSLCFV